MDSPAGGGYVTPAAEALAAWDRAGFPCESRVPECLSHREGGGSLPPSRDILRLFAALLLGYTQAKATSRSL